MARGGNAFWIFIVFGSLTIVALIPLTFYLISSLSPNIIHILSLAKVTGEFIDPSSNVSTKAEVRVGPAGGCVWSNVTQSTKCIAQIPFQPSPELLHLPANNTDIASCFPVGLGRALALNHVTTALMGLSILAVLIDCLILRGGISLAIVYLTIFIMWITFILETVYISVIHHRLDKYNDHHEGTGEEWEYKVGEAYWFVLAATILVSLISCGGNFSIDAN
ncbi:hypothetical protein I302_109089 [Kwoniella bestiolae CBS 10118]|uniref:Uncharacterized protein n=1 Tax=Kwoniella bestiolae CBS 10118 TaxID=1296100 RepID=A0A1B9FUZ4_9TREE|nr:hypothetical protein I302_08234 [Kwoniella bestiolae CBS 10118]OCF22584.1 hypothetical protein I302_08234 [Kwoniella bestiolae CBS 10118]